MELTNTLILNGIFSMLLVIVFIIVGLKVILKYLIYKRRIFILTGLAWIGMSEPWWPSTVGFLLILITGTGLPLTLYLILNNGFLPIFLTCWLFSLGEMMNLNTKKIIVIIYILISVTLEIIMFYYLITDVSMVGTMISPVDVDFGPITVIFLIFNILVFMISSILFTISTLRLQEPENKLRGKFLLIAFILFLFGAIMEVIITLPMNRIIVLVSAIVFYIGFMMPDSIKNRFIKSRA